MTTALVLKHFNLIREVILKTDFLNYVNDEILSQYDDEDILHSMIFYNKNMISAECNYEIYDKELLTIIQCLKHWHLLQACSVFFWDTCSLSEAKTLSSLALRFSLYI